MDKKICAYIFGLTFIALSSIVHGQQGEVQRSPSVEKVVEVDIEAPTTETTTPNPGYNFEATRSPAKMKARVPANIASKTQESGSIIGPLIFLIALPIGLWIVVSKKFSGASDDKKVDYFPKTQQFKPYTTDYQKSAESEDDDIDYPKAS
jgi:hypothetical protein